MKFSIKWALIGGVIGLQVISVSIILASSYLTSQEVLLQHAKDIMGNIAEFTIHEAENYLKPAQDAATLTQRLADSDVVGARNRDSLQSYFYEQLSLQANFAGIYLGLPNGEFIYVNRSSAKAENGFRTKIISLTDAGKVTELIWKDADQQEITREYDYQDVYDPTQRLWYMDARRKRETIWTEPYIFFTSQQPGLTTASPVFDAAGELAGVGRGRYRDRQDLLFSVAPENREKWPGVHSGPQRGCGRLPGCVPGQVGHGQGQPTVPVAQHR